MKRIIIDTDIGDDIDDSLAIALASVSPEIHIAGITTVYKNVRRRAELANKLLGCYGIRNTPVLEGCMSPIASCIEHGETPVLWAAGDDEGYNKEESHAVDFILESLEKDPETIILAIGPMTNLAAAVQKNPSVMKNATVYAMGGAFDSAFAEWNIVCDPEAVAIVLSNILNIRLFGIELTSKVWLEDKDLQEIQESLAPGAKLITRMISSWRSKRGFESYLHDVFPLCGIIYPELFTFTAKKISVELHGTITRGTTVAGADYFRNSKDIPNAGIAEMKNPLIIKQIFMNRVIRDYQGGNS